jgi:hypothetical protein
VLFFGQCSGCRVLQVLADSRLPMLPPGTVSQLGNVSRVLSILDTPCRGGGGPGKAPGRSPSSLKPCGYRKESLPWPFFLNRGNRSGFFLSNASLRALSKYSKKRYPGTAERYDVLCSPSYFAASCGGAPISIIRHHAAQQQTPE